MKKFQFSLDSLKKYNEQVLDGEKTVLGNLRAQLREMQEQLDERFKLLEYAQDRLRLLLRENITVNRVSVQKRYISSLQQDIYRIKAEIEEKNAEIEIQLEKVVEATKEVSKLEKLEEKQLEEYKQQEQKETEQFIEEFVSSSSFYEN